MRRLLLFAGEFDPPQRIHMDALSRAQSQLAPVQTLVLPIPENDAKSEERRKRLCRLAFEELPSTRIAEEELLRSGISVKDAELYLLADSADASEYALSVASSFRAVTVSALPVVPKEDPASLLAGLRSRKSAEMLLPAVYSEIIRLRFYDARPELSWLRELAAAELKPKRIPHVRGCERMAAELAARWEEDSGDAAESAILHDITKKYNDADQLLLCEKYGIMLSADDRNAPPVLHALTGAERAREMFGVCEAVWGAIRWHTTGRAGMTRLEQILYLADAAEETRAYEGADELRALAFEDLHEAMIRGLQMSLNVVQARGSVPHPASADALKWFMEHRKQ